MSRSVVVTGANSGIGLATALELAGAGYDVTGTVRSAAKAADLEAAAAARGLSVRTAILDVADAESTARGFAEIEAHSDDLGRGQQRRLRAGGSDRGRRPTTRSATSSRSTSSRRHASPGSCCRACASAAAGGSSTSRSLAGRMSIPLMGWYCAAKHGIEAMTDSLRIEVAPHGIARVAWSSRAAFGTGHLVRRALPGRAAAPTPTPPRTTGPAGRRRSASRVMPDPVWVARTVRLALGSPVPLARYLVGADAVGGVLAERLVPTAVTDAVKGLATGLRRLPGLPPFRR